MALCLVCFLGMDTSEIEGAPTQLDYLEEAAEYWHGHAYLEAHPDVVTEVSYDVMPNQRTQYIKLLVDRAQEFRPRDPNVVAAEQERLDQLTVLNARGTSGLARGYLGWPG